MSNPDRCDKCAGLVVNLYDDIYCLLCGKRFIKPSTAPIDNDKHRWESVLCEKCHERKAVRGRLLCRWCPGKNYEATEDTTATPLPPF
jgi:hypothetical protein